MFTAKEMFTFFSVWEFLSKNDFRRLKVVRLLRLFFRHAELQRLAVRRATSYRVSVIPTVDRRRAPYFEKSILKIRTIKKAPRRKSESWKSHMTVSLTTVGQSAKRMNLLLPKMIYIFWEILSLSLRENAPKMGHTNNCATRKSKELYGGPHEELHGEPQWSNSDSFSNLGKKNK